MNICVYRLYQQFCLVGSSNYSWTPPFSVCVLLQGIELNIFGMVL